MRESFKHFYTLFLTLCLLLCCGTVASAVPQDSIPEANKPVVVRQPDTALLEKMRADKEFQYYEEVPTGETFWERLKYRIQQWLREVLYKGQASGFWEVLLYLLIAAAIVLIVIKMQHVDVGSLLGKKASNTETPYDVFEENIHELDLKALIAEAVEQHDYRKAVRLHYLQSLKHLTDMGLIQWKPGKTNRSYIAEIQDDGVRREFEQLTGMFEYVWYGGAALGDGLFSSARAEFTQFDNLVKQHA
ncbi:DUF4129 domain-containing protein [Pontibacter korlensis]|uniref:DUF4129 domain-containing protein n=1 Tax=Pontibacter korlensis TaxID=400092 RepID=UPI000696D4CA|nr:DUF4129 domain-containing protein [Pontibacter korlensis]